VHQRGLFAREADGLLVTDHRDRGDDPLGEALGRDVEAAAVAAACLLIDGETFERAGGFGHGYMYGPEDVDLALAVRAAGGAVLCSGRSLLIHPPNTTLGKVDPGLRGAWVRGNRLLFLERWGPRVRREYELDRIDGRGLWAAPRGEPPPPARAEAEALGYCLLAGPQPGLSHELLERLGEAIRARDRRCVVPAAGGAEDELRALECDVAICLRGRARHIPKPAQLSVLWVLSGDCAPPPGERARYDLVVDSLPEPSGERCDELADALLAAIEARARELGFPTRVAPG